MSLTLYRRDGCALCDEAEALLDAVGVRDWQRVQIGWFGELAARYGIRIPVLVGVNGRELDWPFSATEVRDLLDAGAGEGQP